jgi:hypothetical protein
MGHPVDGSAALALNLAELPELGVEVETAGRGRGAQPRRCPGVGRFHAI